MLAPLYDGSLMPALSALGLLPILAKLYADQKERNCLSVKEIINDVLWHFLKFSYQLQPLHRLHNFTILLLASSQSLLSVCYQLLHFEMQFTHFNEMILIGKCSRSIAMLLTFNIYIMLL